MYNEVVFEDQDVSQGMLSEILQLEDYETPSLPADFFDACFRSDNYLDISPQFTGLNSGFTPPDTLALSQKPVLMKHLASPRGTDDWNSPMQNVATGDTQKPVPAAPTFKADDINILTGEQRVNNAISLHCAHNFPFHASASTWHGVPSSSHNWADVPNAQIEAVAGSIRNAAPESSSNFAARATLPPKGSAICKGKTAGVRGKRRKSGNCAQAKGKESSGNNSTKKFYAVKKKVRQSKGAMDTLSEEEQKRIRRVKNRVSVEKCRNKQRMRLEALREEKEVLTNENLLLRNATDRVRQSMSTALSQVAALSGMHCRVQLP